MNQIIIFKTLIISLIIGLPFIQKYNAQTSISLSSGIMEHQVGIPGYKTDELFIIPINITLKHYFEESNIEIGLSHYLYGAAIETHGAYKHPDTYSYWYRARNPINVMVFCGIRSDRNKYMQTYGGIISGYWSHKMYFDADNWNNWTESEKIIKRINQFAFGPKFGLSIGRKTQLILEAEYFWLSKTEYNNRNINKVSLISLGVKHNFNRKE